MVIVNMRRGNYFDRDSNNTMNQTRERETISYVPPIENNESSERKEFEYVPPIERERVTNIMNETSFYTKEEPNIIPIDLRERETNTMNMKKRSNKYKEYFKEQEKTNKYIYYGIIAGLGMIILKTMR